MKKEKDMKQILFLIMALIPVFQPKIFTQYTITTVIYIFLNLFEIVYFIELFYKNEKKISKPLIIWILYRIYIFLIMAVNDNFGGILQWGYITLMVTNLFFVFEYVKGKEEQKLIYSISVIGIAFLTINFITLLIFKNGIIESTFYNSADNAYYFLGIKTQFTTMIFPTITATVFNYGIEKNKKSKKILVLAILVSLLNIFYKKISTAIVGIIMLVILLFVEKKIKIKLDYKIYIAIALCIQIAIIFFNIQQHFAFAIVNILHKDITLSSRIYIWKNTKQLLKEQSLIKLWLRKWIILSQCICAI